MLKLIYLVRHRNRQPIKTYDRKPHCDWDLSWSMKGLWIRLLRPDGRRDAFITVLSLCVNEYTVVVLMLACAIFPSDRTSVFSMSSVFILKCCLERGPTRRIEFAEIPPTLVTVHCRNSLRLAIHVPHVLFRLLVACVLLLVCFQPQ